MVAAALAAAFVSGVANAQTWNGNGGPPYSWSTPFNWSGNTVPVNNGTAGVSFGSTTNTQISFVDIAYSVSNIQFNNPSPGVGAWTVFGSQLTIGSGVSNNNATGPAIFNNSLALSTNSTFTASSGPINLGGNTNTFALGASNVTFAAIGSTSSSINHRITGNGGFVKTGTGTVTFSGLQTNTYTGPTIVNGGLLVLSRPAGVAGNNLGSSVQGPLVINSGEARVTQHEQIADGSPVTIGATGTLSLGNSLESIGPLTLSGGASITGLTALTISPVPTYTVTYASGVTPAVVSSQFRTNNGASVNRVFQVPSAGTIDFNNTFIASGGITLVGGGTLNLNASVLTSAVTAFNINQGTVTIAGGLGSAAPAFNVGSGAAAGSLTLTASTPFTNSPNITLGSAGLLTYSPASSPTTLRVNNLTLSDSSTVLLPSSGVTLAFAGGLTVNAASASTYQQLIAPVVSLPATPVAFNINFGGAASPGDLHSLVFGLITSAATGGIVKIGSGNLQLIPTAGSAIGSLAVNEGTAQITGFAPAFPLIAPGGVVSVTGGATLTGSLTNLSSGAVSLTLSGGSTLSLGGAVADTVSGISLTSSSLTLSSAAMITLAATGTTLTAAQSPGGAVPAVSGLTIGAKPIRLPAGSTHVINVTTATNAASATVGDFNLFAGLSAAATSSTLIKTGPGQLRWEADNLSFGGQFFVNEGSVLLRDPTQSVNGLTGSLFVGDNVLGNNARVVVQNIALDPSLDVVVRRNGTFQLNSSATISSLTLMGGSVTASSGFVLLQSVEGVVVTYPQSQTPLLAVDVLLSNNTIRFDSGSPVSFNIGLDMTSRVLASGTPTTTVTTTGVLAGRLGLTGTSNGSTTFPGNVYVTGATFDANRTGSPHLYNTLTFAGSAVYRSLTARQLAPSAKLELVNNSFALVNLPATESFANLTLRGGGDIYGSGQITVASLTVSDPAVPAFSEIFNPLTVTGPTSISADVTIGGLLNQFNGPVTISGGAFVNVAAVSVFRAAIDVTDSTLFVNGTTVESRGNFTGNNAVIHLIASPDAFFYNRGKLSGTYTIAGDGVLENSGTIVGPSNGPLDFGFSASLFNTGIVDLAGSTLRANSAAQISNTASGTIQGPGIIDLPGNFNNVGTLLAPAGVLSVFQSYTNSGTTRLTSPSALVSAFFINNTGRITGDGQVVVFNNQFITNRGTIEPSPLGQLLLSSRMTNTSTGTLSIPSLSTLVLSSVADANAGLVSLTGGTLQTLPGVGGSWTNAAQGRISGYGTISLPGLRNSGAVTFAGGTMTVNAPVTNDVGRTIRVQAGTALFNMPMTNNGTITLGLGGQAVFAGGGTGIPSGAPTSGGAINAVVGTGITSLAPGSAMQTDGISQAGLFIVGSVASPSSLEVLSREPGGQILPTGRTAAPSLSVLGTLSITGNGLLDLTTNDLLLRSSNPVADVVTLQQYAQNHLTSGGTLGMGTSSPNPFHRLGIYPNDLSLTGGSPASAGLSYYEAFDGTALLPGDVLVRLTYIGDTNVDGRLDGFDLANVIEGFSTGATGWWNGDFDYSGAVTPADLAAFQSAYAAYNSGQLPDLGLPGAWGGGGSGAIPEPGTASVLAVPAAALFTRRRRR